ncbi:hypothetical protein [Paenibacillus ginsengarvi]|uniref:Uncharacterized protein n=1 Tax=Paenibacillus ginsengarvi TaxID=400777 RepID=A0A3B0CNS4_9BACL|nr:hypothetical protein [Paenibacillus ginsengarvi]RKN86762.1 hypothetical protein D7M11_02045 [Paenibacillus ginsengarvi]
MNEHEVMQIMGRLPDNIILHSSGGMKSKTWKCSTCKTIHESEQEVRPPSPCGCGSRFFEKILPKAIVATE